VQGDQPAISYDDFVAYFDSMSNWGRWGPDDQRGALNLITPEKVAAAARLVELGVRVPCGRTVEFAPRPTAAEAPVPPIHFMQKAGEGAPLHGMGNAYDWAGLPLHGLYLTHLDAPSHVFWNGAMYNGVAAARVTSERGALAGAVELAGDGIVSRGVLLDVAATRGVTSLDDGEGVTPDDLEAAESRAGTRVTQGDVMFVRTGYGARRPSGNSNLPGLTPECLPFIRDREPAVVATDTGTDVFPPRFEDLEAPVHAVCLVAMGVWIIDNCELEALHEMAEQTQRRAFLVAISPLRLRSSTGCPVNPIAIY
jgi:kynurenine formamidase